MALAISYSQSMSGTLAERAMLVDLTIRQWSATASDKSANRETAQRAGADESMTRFSKSLLKSEKLDALRKIATAASAEHRTRTLPWLDSGARILSSAGYFDYASAMRVHEDQWTAAVDAFLQEYETAIWEAQRSLGTLFNWGDYPSESQLRKRFAFGYNVLPLPSADDFRVSLGSEQVALIRSQIEAATQAALESALADVYERVQDVVGRMSERLRAYQPATGAGDKAVGVFRDTLIENVRDLVGLLPSLNVTGNYRLAQLAQRMDTELLQYSADTLRVNQRAREEVASAAEDILAKMADFV